MRRWESQSKNTAPPMPTSTAIIIAKVDRNTMILRPPVTLRAIAHGTIRLTARPRTVIPSHMAPVSVVGVEEDGHDAAQQQQPSGRGNPEGPEQPLEEPAHVAAPHRVPDQRDDDRSRAETQHDLV